ncbi:MAG: hypothetical protein K1X35_07525 [Caulobacteraceae bacterium]|nr:hypothetical protein [Caulobacteraceae bacterium]
MGPDIAIVVAGWAFALGVLIWSEHNWPALMRWLARSAVFTGAVLITLWGRYEFTLPLIGVVVAAGLLLSGLPIVHELIFHAARAPRRGD